MDGPSIFLTKGTEEINVATSYDNAGQHAQALEHYKAGCELLVKALKYDKNPASQKIVQEKIVGYMDRAEEIKKALKGGDESGEHSPPPNGSGQGAATVQRKPGEKKADEDKAKLVSQLEDAIVKERPNVKWSDVAGLELAKESLKEAVILPTKFPQLFTGMRKPWKGILLYGPPGTGKTHLARAVATEADGSQFYSVSASDLTSKWLGEGEKLVRTLFSMAVESKPSVVFIDEIDSVCSARSDGEQEANRRIKTEFMAQMDGVGKNMEGVLVLGATNRPSDIDAAIQRRFEKRVYIALPEAPARAHMFEINLGDTPHSLSPEQFAQLGDMTPLYSGSDIKTCTKEALMEPVRKCRKARQFLLDAEGMFTPCEDYPNCPECPIDLSPEGARVLGYTPGSLAQPGQPNQCAVCRSVRLTLDQMPDPTKLKPPLITFRDFVRALQHSKPTSCAADLERYEQYTRDTGSEGK